MNHRESAGDVALLLDEMHSPLVAATLRDRGHDVVALADEPYLRSMTDDEVIAHAAAEGRRIVTENVKDFRPLLRQAEESGRATLGILFTSSRTFRRSRRNPGPLIDALDAWLQDPDASKRPLEDWLVPT